MLSQFVTEWLASARTLFDGSNLPYFLDPWFLLFALGAPLVVWLRYRRQARVVHSNVDLHSNLGSSKIGRIPAILLGLWVVLLAVALARPVQDYTVEKEYVEAHEIVLGVDFSGSMDAQDIAGAAAALLPPGIEGCLNGEHKEDNDRTVERTSLRRINAACFAVTNFVMHRAGDRIGLIMFSNEAYWLLPLWLDQKVILEQAQLINRRGTSGGTNFDGPSKANSQMGPLQLGINHLSVYGQSKARVMIMVTDGEDSIAEERRQELADQFAKMGIHLYVLGVGSGWAEGKNPDLAKLVQLVEGGAVFPVKDGDSLKAAFAKIDELEKSKIQREVTVKHRDWYPVALVLAFGVLIIFLRLTRATREQA
jgi:Ca-activated chloride channel family protein